MPSGRRRSAAKGTWRDRARRSSTCLCVGVIVWFRGWSIVRGARSLYIRELPMIMVRVLWRCRCAHRTVLHRTRWGRGAALIRLSLGGALGPLQHMLLIIDRLGRSVSLSHCLSAGIVDTRWMCLWLAVRERASVRLLRLHVWGAGCIVRVSWRVRGGAVGRREGWLDCRQRVAC